MANVEALRKRLVDRLASNRRSNMIFADITSSLNSASPEVKAQIIDALNRNDSQRFYNIVHQLLTDNYKSVVTPNVNVIISRGNLTLDDVEDIFGPL